MCVEGTLILIDTSCPSLARCGRGLQESTQAHNARRHTIQECGSWLWLAARTYTARVAAAAALGGAAPATAEAASAAAGVTGGVQQQRRRGRRCHRWYHGAETAHSKGACRQRSCAAAGNNTPALAGSRCGRLRGAPTGRCCHALYTSQPLPAQQAVQHNRAADGSVRPGAS